MTKAQIMALVDAGEKMSNLCFNYSQTERALGVERRLQLKRAQVEWDRARQALGIGQRPALGYPTAKRGAR